MRTNLKRPVYRTVDSEKVLLKKLYLRILAVILILLTLVLSLSFFGPNIGSLFLLVSKNRNITGPADTIPPTLPTFSSIPERTKERKLTINGLTEPGAKVELFVNGPKTAETTADNDGSFTFIDIEIGDKTNTVFAKAIDSSGNESENSKIHEVIFDDKNPEITIISPKHGDTIKNLNQRILVQGKVNEEAEVKINNRQAVVRSDLSFELLLGVDEGEVFIKIEAIDKAGNKEEKIITVTYVKSS